MTTLKKISNKRFPHFDEIEWSQRSGNAFARSGITSWKQVMAMDSTQLRALRGIGVKSVREIAGHLVRAGIRPKFINAPWHIVRTADTTGMVLLAGPFEQHQRGMLESAIALLDGVIDWAVTPDPLHPYSLNLWRSAKGFKPVDELADGE